MWIANLQNRNGVCALPCTFVLSIDAECAFFSCRRRKFSLPGVGISHLFQLVQIDRASLIIMEFQWGNADWHQLILWPIDFKGIILVYPSWGSGPSASFGNAVQQLRILGVELNNTDLCQLKTRPVHASGTIVIHTHWGSDALDPDFPCLCLTDILTCIIGIAFLQTKLFLPAC